MVDQGNSWDEIRKLFDAQYDFLAYAGEPKKTFMIATTPRTGSSLLSLKLWQTGEHGAPWEYFHLNFSWPMIRRLDPASALDFFVKLTTVRTSPNGVFGHKAFYNSFEGLKLGYPDLHAKLINTKVVFLRRRDVDAQARSLMRAKCTRAWFQGAPEWREDKYDPVRFEHCRSRIRRQNDGWEEFFRVSRVQVWNMYYEDLASEPDAELRKVVAFLGVGSLGHRISVPIPSRQGVGLPAQPSTGMKQACYSSQ